jgi:hypothetical protein
MAEPDYAPEFVRRIIAQEAPGGTATQVSLVIPSVTIPGEAFRIRIAILDRASRAAHCDRGGVLVIDCPGSDIPATTVTVDVGPFLCSLDGMTLPADGFFRFRAVYNGTVDWSNPTLCGPPTSRRLSWGDPHLHTNLGRCHLECTRSLNFCYSNARHVGGLDWIAITDHVSNGRCDRAKWQEQRTVCELYNDPPSFATIPAYEASFTSRAGGDINVYLNKPLPEYIDEYESGTARTLADRLDTQAAQYGNDFFMVPHHTTRADKYGELADDIWPGAQRMPLIELASKWGASEYRGNPGALLTVHDGPCHTTDLLERGLQLGFVGGTDSHASATFESGSEPAQLHATPGITAVWTESNDRNALFNSLRRRDCYAASMERIYLEVDICGLRSGSAADWPAAGAPSAASPLAASPSAASPAAESLVADWPAAGNERIIRVRTAAPGLIRKIELVRNGQLLATQHIDSWHGATTFIDRDAARDVCLQTTHMGDILYYYVRVQCDSGARAWSSPIWLHI